MGGGEEEEEGREGPTHYVVEQFVAEVRLVWFPNLLKRGFGSQVLNAWGLKILKFRIACLEYKSTK